MRQPLTAPGNARAVQVCGSGQDEHCLLLCDACNRGYHTYCCSLPHIPEGEWHCPDCLAARAPQRGTCRMSPAMQCCAVPVRAVQCCGVLCCGVLCWSVLRLAVPRHALLCRTGARASLASVSMPAVAGAACRQAHSSVMPSAAVGPKVTPTPPPTSQPLKAAPPRRAHTQ
jgi:hypothetical protein